MGSQASGSVDQGITWFKVRLKKTLPTPESRTDEPFYIDAVRTRSRKRAAEGSVFGTSAASKQLQVALSRRPRCSITDMYAKVKSSGIVVPRGSMCSNACDCWSTELTIHS